MSEALPCLATCPPRAQAGMAAIAHIEIRLGAPSAALVLSSVVVPNFLSSTLPISLRRRPPLLWRAVCTRCCCCPTAVVILAIFRHPPAPAFNTRALLTTPATSLLMLLIQPAQHCNNCPALCARHSWCQRTYVCPQRSASHFCPFLLAHLHDPLNSVIIIVLSMSACNFTPPICHRAPSKGQRGGCGAAGARRHCRPLLPSPPLRQGSVPRVAIHPHTCPDAGWDSHRQPIAAICFLSPPPARYN